MMRLHGSAKISFGMNEMGLFYFFTSNLSLLANLESYLCSTNYLRPFKFEKSDKEAKKFPYFLRSV